MCRSKDQLLVHAVVRVSGYEAAPRPREDFWFFVDVGSENGYKQIGPLGLVRF